MIRRWMKENLLKLSPQKTEVIILTKKRKVAQIFLELLEM